MRTSSLASLACLYTTTTYLLWLAGLQGASINGTVPH